MLQVANTVSVEGYCLLPQAFNIVSPTVKYRAEQARRMLLQIPLASIRIGEPSSGKSFSVLVEKIHGADFAKIGFFINSLASSFRGTNQKIMEKSCVKMLLSFAQSDRERQCIRYAVVKASGISFTAARRRYGFSSISQSVAKIEEAISDAMKIKEAIHDISVIQDCSLLMQFGLVDQESSSSSEDESEVVSPDEDFIYARQTFPREICNLPEDYIRDVLKQSDYNWFEVCDRLEQEFPNSNICSKVSSMIPVLGLKEDELSLITQSSQAFAEADTTNYELERIANMINGDVVTDSESDDPEQYVGINDPFSSNAVKVIAKQRAINKRQMQRFQAKIIAEENFLARKVSKKVSRILKECPDIGTVIEKYVEEHSVGADAWRRTGVLTFDGNSNLKQKVTFKRIQEHLQHVYHKKISFGSVVQLCVARNKRRISAKRYLGIAKVTTRRARKGFNLRYNPDSHWSAAFYKGLNDIQYKDGRYVTIINRDDASGFRLDTLTTHKQHPTPALQDKAILTTRTDYVNKHASTLQTTSYNFTATNTTSETCVGVVKALPLHKKNPCQHSADLKMLETKEELQHVFYTNDGAHKLIDCIRVDGASDEGPSHEEVQYYWTERHIYARKATTLVTTRSSGSSYLNRVELQNGCLALGHSNTYIPSTLAGSCLDPQSGAINEDKLKENLNIAIDAYISRVNGCPCGGTSIQLYRGAESNDSQVVREKLLIFLKGSKKAKESLMRQSPTLYKQFEAVWKVRNNHMITDLPSQYVFFLICCYKKGCTHELCQAGEPVEPITWYPGGPTIHHLPFPILDEDRPWGNTQCTSCKGFCAGHYKILTIDVTAKAEKKKIIQPPSIVLKRLLPKILSHEMSIKEAAKSVLIPEEDCKIWIEHIKTVVENRKRGAKKAALTRSRKEKKGSECVSDASDEISTYCGTCGEEFGESDDVTEIWIACDLCNAWYHCSCEGLRRPPTKGHYICNKCQH